MGYVASVPEPEPSSAGSSFLQPCPHGEVLHRCLQETPASRWIGSRTRRALEIGIALAVLSVAAVPMLIICALIRLTSRGPAIYSQERVGRQGRLFRIYKFRSMRADGAEHGPGLTRAGDSRVTPMGRFLRRFKLDELPQFYNILRGDMSLVGPRPKLPQYTGTPNMDYRPGITGLATLVFRHEEELMRDVATHRLDEFYSQHIKPVKTQIDTCYMCTATPWSDLRIVLHTALGSDSLPVLRPAASCMRFSNVSRQTAPFELASEESIPFERV